MNHFHGENTRHFTLGNPIPIPAFIQPPVLDLFVPMACFEVDRGADPTDAARPPSKPSISGEKRTRLTSVSQKSKRPYTVVEETFQEEQAPVGRTETAPIGSEAQSDAPATSTIPPPPSTFYSDVHTANIPSFVPSMTSPSPMSGVGSGAGSEVVTMDKLLYLLNQRDEAAERRRREEMRQLEERSNKRDEMMMKHFEMMTQTLLSQIQRPSPTPSSSTGLPILPLRQVAAAPTDTPSTSDLPSSTSKQTDQPTQQPGPTSDKETGGPSFQAP